jgi:hypothetical protein
MKAPASLIYVPPLVVIASTRIQDKYMPAPTFEDVQGNVQGPSAPATKTVGTPVLAMDDIS